MRNASTKIKCHGIRAFGNLTSWSRIYVFVYVTFDPYNIYIAAHQKLCARSCGGVIKWLQVYIRSPGRAREKEKEREERDGYGG